MRIGAKYSNYGRGDKTSIVELTTRLKAELLMSIKAEAVGRCFNAGLTSQPSLEIIFNSDKPQIIRLTVKL